jgi:hypothetical protein
MRAGQGASPQATIRQQAGSYRARHCLLVFVGDKPARDVCRATGVTSGDDSPAGWLLQGTALSACLCGGLPASDSCGARGITSGDDSPAGWLLQGDERAACLCGSLPASDVCRATGVTSRDDSPAGWLLQGDERAVCLCGRQACKRFVWGKGRHLRRRFASQMAWRRGRQRAAFKRRGCASSRLSERKTGPGGS